VADSPLLGINQDVLPGSRLNTKPYTKAPFGSGLANASFIGATFVARDLAKLHELQVARRSWSALPGRPAVVSNNEDVPQHGRMSDHPCNNKVADRDVSTTLAFKAELCGAEAALRQTHG
jgi:hypothetical protein